MLPSKKVKSLVFCTPYSILGIYDFCKLVCTSHCAGFALGIGIVMAERVLISLMGPLVIHHKTFASSTASAATEPSVTSSGALNACDIPSKDFVDL